MKSFKIVETPDSRDTCPPEVLAGVYFVQKRNVIKQFRFGEGCEYPDIRTAHSEMKRFLSNRADSDSLRVSLIQRKTKK